MNNDQLLDILKSLSQGVDPDSKELLESNHILNRPSVIRALCNAAQVIDKVNTVQNNGWSISEESMLLKYHYSNFSVLNTANEMNRSCESIILKLIELEVIEDLKVA
jgi:hypothetical protein